MQINLLVDTIFASYLPVGSLSWLYYSDRLLEFPVGLFGVALATVVLPHLSKHYSKGEEKSFSQSIDWALRLILIVGLPASLGLALLSGPIITTLFHYGEFTQIDVQMARLSLMAYSSGLVAFLAVKVLVSAFYARRNTRFPVKVAVVCLLANIVFNALLIGPMAHAGLALASVISSFINVSLLLVTLVRAGHYKIEGGWSLLLMRLSLANLCLVAFLIFASPSLDQFFEWGLSHRAGQLFYLIIGAAFCYFVTLRGLGLKFRDIVAQNA